MRVMNFVPSVCKEVVEEVDGKQVSKPKTFEGHLVVKMPHFKERAMMLKALRFKLNDKGEMDAKMDPGEILEGLGDIAENMIVESHLVRISDGVKLSKEDLFYEPDCSSVITECANAVMNSGGPSKNL